MPRTLLPLLLTAAPAFAQAPTAFAIDTNLDILYSIDLATGAPTQIGSTLNNTLATAADLCWRDDTNELWTVDLSGGAAGILDTTTAIFTPVWQTGLSGWQGMAWDHSTGKFFLHNQNDQLHVLDPVTGTTTLVGTLATTSPLVTALEVVGSGRLWAMDFSAGAILEIDKNTGLEISRIATPGMTNVQGFNIDADGTWYAITTNTDSLYVVDPTTGASVLIGPVTGTQFVKGFAVTSSSIQRYGTACADGAQATRRMFWSGGSNLGNFVLHGCDAGPVTAPALVAYGFSGLQAGPFALPFDLGNFGAPGCKLLQSTDAIIGPTVTGSPQAFVVPNLAGLVGLTVYSQVAILDVSASPNAAGLAFSDAIKMTIVP